MPRRGFQRHRSCYRSVPVPPLPYLLPSDHLWLTGSSSHYSKEAKAFLRPSLRQHVFFRMFMRKGIRVPLPYALASRTFSCASGDQGNAGRTPFLLSTLLPLLLTLPSPLTFAALLLLSPGERSHQLKSFQPCPLPIIIQDYSAVLKCKFTYDIQVLSACSICIAFHPCPNQILHIIYLLCDLFVLLWQDALLLHGKLSNICQQSAVCKRMSLVFSALSG